MDSDDEELVKYNYDLINKYMHNIGNTYFNDAKYNCAIIIYNKILDNIIDNDLMSIICSNKSACYLKLEDYNNAINEGIKSIQFNKINPVSWGRIGWALKKLKKYNEALNAFKIASKLNPYNLNYKNEIYYFNSKKIDKINFFNLFKSSDYIMKKIHDINFRNNILNNSLTPENLINNYEFIKLIDYIISKI